MTIGVLWTFLRIRAPASVALDARTRELVFYHTAQSNPAMVLAVRYECVRMRALLWYCHKRAALCHN